MKESKIYLKSRDYIEGWLKGAGWQLSCCPFDTKITDELTHYIHDKKSYFTYSISMFNYANQDISKYISKCIGNKNMYNLLGLMIHPDWLIMEENDFYNFLRSQFTTLEEAKTFYKKWKKNDQVIENHPDWEFSLRAMAAHISNVLEGKKKDDHKFCTDYMETKCGSEIYWC